MNDQLQDVLDGQIGKFWPFEGKFSGELLELHGYVRKLDSGTIQLEALDERDHVTAHRQTKQRIPSFAAGSTASSGIILAQRSGESSNRVLGGCHTSVLKYRYRTAFAKVDLAALRTGRVTKLRAHFPDMLRWAGLTAIKYDRKVDPENKLKECTITLGSDDDTESFSIGDGLSLCLETDWSLDGPSDHQTVLTGLGVEVETRRPRPVSDLVMPLIDVQLLLSTAHEGWVPCRSARARMDYRTTGYSHNYCPMWDRDLMRIPDRAIEPGPPLFWYSDLNGSSGLRRWMRLNREHGRFLRPATMRPLFAGMVGTTKLMELYAAIEYYVAASRKAKRKWAPRGKTAPAIVLASHASSHFSTFVGNTTKWAEKLHELYNQIKHEPTDVDPGEVHWFAESARVLILSISLDYASQRTAASKRLLTDYRMEHISQRIQAIIT